MQRESDGEFEGTERFEIKRTLGAGGMGVVYEAFDHERGTPVAIKTLQWASAASLYRFKQEFRALADIEHPNLISLGELFESDGHWFFTMELIDGVDFLRYVRGEPATLDDARRDPTAPTAPHHPARPPRDFGRAPTSPGLDVPHLAHPYDERRLRAAAGQLALALAALHQADKVHRDIKPSNILVTREGKLVLLDFGLVTNAAGDVSASTQGDAAGTAVYMAPEQALSGAVGPAADWYGFGTVLYEALTGQLPYSGANAIEVLLRKQEYDPPPPRARNPDVPRDLDGLCADLLTRNPAERPSGRAILERLGVDTAAPLLAAPTASHLTESAIFIGRQAELMVLRRAYEDTRRGAASVVVIEGESGVGKSALVAELTAMIRADVPDAVVLEGRCYERESVPYKAFDGLVDALSRYLKNLPKEDVPALLPLDTALLSRAFPVLGRVEAVARARRPEHEIDDPHELRKRTFAALRELLRRLAETHPVILAIDDMQWADRDSLQLLEDLLLPPRAPPLLLLVTARPPSRSGNDESGDSEPYLAIPIPGLVHRVALGPLDDETARELAGLLLRRANLEQHVDAAVLAGEAAGHPLYIDELVRHATSSGGQRLRLDDAIAARASELPAAARAILELVCVAGASVPQAVIAQASELEAALFTRQLSLLRMAHLVRTGGARHSDAAEPYHDRVREALLAAIDDQRQQHCHARLAVALATTGGAPELLLRHLEGAGETRRAAEVAIEAADRASGQLAFDRAAAFYRAALRLGEWSTERARELNIQLGIALANAGRASEAGPVFAAAADGADPATLLDCYRQAAEQWLKGGYIERGLEMLDKLLAEIGTQLPATPRRALTSLLWHRAALRLRRLRWSRTRETALSREELTRVDVYNAVSHGLSVVDTVRGADFQARGLLRALRAGEPIRVGRALATESLYVASQGGRGFARAGKLAEQVRAIAEAENSEFLSAWATAADGFRDYFQGRFRAASASLERAESMFRQGAAGTTWEQVNTRVLRVFTLRHQGALAALGELGLQSIADARARGDRYLETTVRRHGTIVWLARDAVAEAHDNLARAVWMPPEGVFHLQHWYELEALIDLALYEGRGASAYIELAPRFDALRSSLLLRIQLIRAVATWGRGRLVLAASASAAIEPARAARELRTLCRSLAGERIGFATVMANQLRAGSAALAGDTPAAVTALDAAIAAAGDEMLLHVAVARRHKGVLLGGHEGAALVAEGEAWLRGEGVADPARFAHVYAPGFTRAR